MSGDVLTTQTKLSSLTKKVSDDEVLLQQLTDAKQAAVTGESGRERERERESERERKREDG